MFFNNISKEKYIQTHNFLIFKHFTLFIFFTRYDSRDTNIGLT